MAAIATQANLITEESLTRIVSQLLDERLEGYNHLKEENAKLKKKVLELEEEIEEGQIYTRRNNVVAYNVPMATGENPIQVAIELGRTANMELKPDDIDIAHRLRSKRDDQPPPFIIRFVHRHKKIELLKRTRPVKPTPGEGENQRDPKGKPRGIIFRDQLSPRSQQIFNHAHILWSEYFVWSWKGGIYCRKDGEEDIIPLKSLEEVDELAKDIVFEEKEDETGRDVHATQSQINDKQSSPSPPHRLRPRRNTGTNQKWKGRRKGQGSGDLSNYGFQASAKSTDRQTPSSNHHNNK